MYRNKWTDRFRKACFLALKEIQPYIGKKEDIKTLKRGAGGDLTATIDYTAEKIILEHLKSYHDPFHFVSEEIGLILWSSINQDSPYSAVPSFQEIPYIILDPIDGSSNAILGIPFACISIALTSSESCSSVSVGCILNIFTKDFYWAEKNNGAYKNSTQIHCNSPSSLNRRYIAIDFFHNKFESTYSIPHNLLFKNAGIIRMMGSCALELCLVAEGAFDAYFDFRSTLRVVDFLAGIIILSEAGGVAFDADGNFLECKNFSLTEGYNLIAVPISLQNHIQTRLKER